MQQKGMQCKERKRKCHMQLFQPDSIKAVISTPCQLQNPATHQVKT